MYPSLLMFHGAQREPWYRPGELQTVALPHVSKYLENRVTLIVL